MDAAPDRHEVIVIGGGQAGLALGYHLARQRGRFTILDAGESPAAVWRAGSTTTLNTSPTRSRSSQPSGGTPLLDERARQRRHSHVGLQPFSVAP
jgi:cation diffusion facilitator CzcD-associated flavoprotein CzcO